MAVFTTRQCIIFFTSCIQFHVTSTLILSPRLRHTKCPLPPTPQLKLCINYVCHACYTPVTSTALHMIKVSETSTAAQSINKFRVFYGTRQNIIMTLLRVKGIQSTVFSHLLHSLWHYWRKMPTEIYRGIVSFGIFLLHLNAFFPNSDQCYILTAKLHLHPSNGNFEQRLTYTSVIWCKLQDSMLTAWERHYMHTRSVSYMRVLSGDRIPVTSRFSAPIQTGSGAFPASNIGSILVVQRPKRGFNHPSTPIWRWGSRK